MTIESGEPGAAPRLLTAGQVARLFGVTRLTVGRWCAKGTFPAPVQPAGPGGRRYWPEAAVESVLRGERPAT